MFNTFSMHYPALQSFAVYLYPTKRVFEFVDYLCFADIYHNLLNIHWNCKTIKLVYYPDTAVLDHSTLHWDWRNKIRNQTKINWFICIVVNCSGSQAIYLLELETEVHEDITITVKAPTRAACWFLLWYLWTSIPNSRLLIVFRRPIICETAS